MTEATEAITVGIDLGTTNTLACVWTNGKPKIIPIDGKKMLPSAVYVREDGSVIVGYTALNLGIADPYNLIRSAKTYMATDKEWHCHGRTFTPTDVATEVLKKVRADIETWMKKKKYPPSLPIHALITVPADFNGRQKEETRLAGKRAGFVVSGIVTEPMAAALYSAQDEYEEDEESAEAHKRVLVVDLGGGTLDLSVLDADPASHEYHAVDTEGDKHLGGDDFDDCLFTALCDQVKSDMGCDLSDLATSGLPEAVFHQVRHRLREAAVRAKEDLSTPDAQGKRIALSDLMDYRGKRYDFETFLTREEFETICQKLFDKVTHRLEHFLAQGEKNGTFLPSEIDHVILAGGSCNMLKIQEDVERITGCPVNMERELDKLVVYGASLIAHSWTGIDATRPFHDNISHSLGVSIMENGKEILSKIIKKNEEFPTSKTMRYRTEYAGQTEAIIKIYEAGPDAEDIEDIAAHDFYDGFVLKGLQPDEDGKPSIDITFSYDASGCLTVEAVDIKTGKSKVLTIEGGAKKRSAKEGAERSQRPVDFVLMMDASGSMISCNRMPEAKVASHYLVDELIDFRVHRMGLVAIDSCAKSIVTLTNDKKRLKRGIDSLTPGGSTNVVDALQHMNRMFDPNDDRKHVGILVSDGDPDDRKGTEALARSLRSDGIRLIFIGVGSNIHELNVAEPEDTYTIENMHDLSETLSTVIPGITKS